MSNLPCSVKVTELSERHFGLVTVDIFLLPLSYSCHRAKAPPTSGWANTQALLYKAHPRERISVSLGGAMSELLLSHIEGENIKWAGGLKWTVNNRNASPRTPPPFPPSMTEPIGYRCVLVTLPWSWLSKQQSRATCTGWHRPAP